MPALVTCCNFGYKAAHDCQSSVSLTRHCLSESCQPSVFSTAQQASITGTSADAIRLSVVRFVLQSLEIAAQKTHSLKKKGLREGILSILAPAGRDLLRSLQDEGSIGQFELDSACISWLAKLPPHQQAQVRLPRRLCLYPAEHDRYSMYIPKV